MIKEIAINLWWIGLGGIALYFIVSVLCLIIDTIRKSILKRKFVNLENEYSEEIEKYCKLLKKKLDK